MSINDSVGSLLLSALVLAGCTPAPKQAVTLTDGPSARGISEVASVRPDAASHPTPAAPSDGPHTALRTEPVSDPQTCPDRSKPDESASVVHAIHNDRGGPVAAGLGALFLQTQGVAVPPAPPAAEDEPAGLTLAELEQLALSNNPTLAQAASNISAAEGRWVQAGLYPNPRLAYQANEIGQESAGGQQGFYVAQEIVRGGKLGLSQNVAGYEIGQRRSQYAVQQQRVLTAVRVAFYDMLAAQRGMELAQQLVEIGEAGVEMAEARIAGQQGTRIDLLQARVELNRARVTRRNAENRLQAAWQELTSVAGVPQMELTTVVGDLHPVAAELDAESMMQQIIASSPQLAAARQEMGRAQAALRRARVEPVPNVDAQVGLQYDDATDYTVANLQFELPLPIINRNQGNVLAASAEWAAASRNVERLELELRNGFAAVAEEYANATFEVERYSTSILPDAEATLNLVTEVYESGEISYLQLLTAQRTNFQTQIEYLAALRRWWQSRLAIDGLLLTDGLLAPTE